MTGNSPRRPFCQGSYPVGRVAIYSDRAQLAKALGGVLVVVLPTTDVVLHSSEATAVSIDALRALARQVASKSASPLTLAVLRWADDGWQLVGQ